MAHPIHFDVAKNIYGLARKVDYLKTPPIDVDNAQQIKALLIQHGCTLVEYEDHCVLSFPEGTQRQRGMTLGISEPYTLLMPDGFKISEVYDIVRELSFLLLPKMV
jgi:hypothetical protein